MRHSTRCAKSFPSAVLVLTAAAGGFLQAGELDGHLSNQSTKGDITLTLSEECVRHEDVLVSLLDPPPGAGKAALAPALLRGADRSWTLKPGQTAVITLKTPPSPAEAPVRRHFRVTQAGAAGRCGFTYQVDLKDGKPVVEVQPDEGADPRADLEQADPNLVLFWGWLLTGW
jgi:hypothetical protein